MKYEEGVAEMWLFLFIFAVILGLNIYSVILSKKNLNYLTKPFLVISLLAYYLLNPGEPELFVILALSAGLAGDILLMLPDSKKYFIGGLLAFLAGHLSYILAFIKTSNYAGETGLWFYLLSIPYLAFGTIINIILIPRVGKLGVFVILYDLTITGMGISSLLSLKLAPDASFLLPIAGALLFIVSDTLLSFAKFKVIKGNTGLVMLTYGLAQLLITLWFSLCKL